MPTISCCVSIRETNRGTPSAKDFDDDKGILKGSRFAFYNDQFYSKNTSEMLQLFNDLPESLDNTNEIVEKIKTLDSPERYSAPELSDPGRV